VVSFRGLLYSRGDAGIIAIALRDSSGVIAVRQIDISELKPANEHGTCNACDAQITELGTLPGAKVYEVTLRRLSFRLCSTCAAIFYAGLAGRLRRDGAV
jgi:hypothetical protein